MAEIQKAAKITLRDWAPREFLDYSDVPAYKHLDVEVVAQYGYIDGNPKPWPGKEKNVHSWCVLANGRAVAWNENPARGWSFPLIRYRG